MNITIIWDNEDEKCEGWEKSIANLVEAALLNLVDGITLMKKH